MGLDRKGDRDRTEDSICSLFVHAELLNIPVNYDTNYIQTMPDTYYRITESNWRIRTGIKYSYLNCCPQSSWCNMVFISGPPPRRPVLSVCLPVMSSNGLLLSSIIQQEANLETKVITGQSNYRQNDYYNNINYTYHTSYVLIPKWLH